MVYKLTPAVSLYASYSQSLKPISTIAPHSSGLIDSSVKPESGKSWEVGTKYKSAGGLTGTLTLFDINPAVPCRYGPLVPGNRSFGTAEYFHLPK